MNTGSHSSHLLNPQHRTKASQPVDTYVVQIKVRQNSQPIQKIWRGDSLLSIGHPIQWTIETTETGMRMRDLRSPINLVSKTAVKEIEFSEIFEKEWIELPLSENSKNTPASVRIRKTKTLEALYNSIETGKEILLVQYLNQSILDSFPLKDSSFVQYGGENLFQTQWENENLKVTSQLSELQVRQDKKNIPSENGTWSIPRSKLLNTSIHLNALSWKFGTESAGSIPQIPHIEIKKELGDESRFFKKSIQGIIGALAIFLITIALWPQAEEKEEEKELIPAQFAKIVLKKSKPAPAASAGATSAAPQKAKQTAVVQAFRAKALKSAVSGLLKGGMTNLLKQSQFSMGVSSRSSQTKLFGAAKGDFTSAKKVALSNQRKVGVGTLGGQSAGGKGIGYGKGKRAGISGQGNSFVALDTTGSSIEEGLTKDQVGRVIHQHMSEIRYCYESSLLRNPNIDGKLVVDFKIGGHGKVVSTAVKNSSLGEPRLDDCILRRLRTWKFPIPKGGVGVAVSYPFIFKPLQR